VRLGCTDDRRSLAHLDGPILLDMVRKVASIEIALERTDIQDEIGTFDAPPHFWTTDLSNVNLVGEHKRRAFLLIKLHLHHHNVHRIRREPSCPSVPQRQENQSSSQVHPLPPSRNAELRRHPQAQQLPPSPHLW